ncbi:hypothetical protein [Rhodospirillaceae bacterium SYSU D60014]|uniref:hypothetical protein n=1 Tax=Virgifigura deserti TaxID=2268457 RepID=UPI0013C48DAC
MKSPKAVALLIFLLAGGCTTPTMNGVAPADELSPVPASVAGTYRLQSVNDQALPALVGSWDDCREDLLSAALTLRPNRRYLMTATARQECAGAAPIESRGRGTQGRYTVQGDTIRLDDEPTMLAGAAGPGWVDDYSGRRFAVEEIEGVGMLDGDTLTLRLEGGGIATFRRMQR